LRIAIDFESETPIYLQLRNQVIRAIARKELINNDSLPAVRSLGEDLGINLHTVNKAYSLLKQEGFISIHRRKGVIVTLDGSHQLTELRRNKLLNNIRQSIEEAIAREIDEEEFLETCRAIFLEYQEDIVERG
jgi:GntR family transcriptional regulator